MAAVTPNLEHRTTRGNPVRDHSRIGVISTRHQSCRLTRGVHTTHLHRHRLDSRGTQYEHRYQRRDAEGGFDGDGSSVVV